MKWHDIHKHVSCSLISHTPLQHSSPTPLYTTTLLSDTSPQHSSLQHFSPTLFRNTPVQNSGPTLPSNTSLQHSSRTLLYNTCFGLIKHNPLCAAKDLSLQCGFCCHFLFVLLLALALLEGCRVFYHIERGYSYNAIGKLAQFSKCSFTVLRVFYVCIWFYPRQAAAPPEEDRDILSNIPEERKKTRFWSLVFGHLWTKSSKPSPSTLTC